jgi:hypothetical protein
MRSWEPAQPDFREARPTEIDADIALPVHVLNHIFQSKGHHNALYKVTDSNGSLSASSSDGSASNAASSWRTSHTVLALILFGGGIRRSFTISSNRKVKPRCSPLPLSEKDRGARYLEQIIYPLSYFLPSLF